MTTADDRDLRERDEEALRQQADPAPSPHEPAGLPADLMEPGEVERARVARYAEAIAYRHRDISPLPAAMPVDIWIPEALSVIPVADQEQAALVAENERLERVLDQELEARDHWEGVADHLAYAIAPESVIGEHSSANDPHMNALREVEALHRRAERAESAEAEVGRLRVRLAKVEAAGLRVLGAHGRRCNVCTGHSPEWDGHDKNPPCEAAALAELRAALGEGCPCTDGNQAWGTCGSCRHLTHGQRSVCGAALADAPTEQTKGRHHHSRKAVECAHTANDCCVECCEPGGVRETSQ